jgi:hypothetical protein
MILQSIFIIQIYFVFSVSGLTQLLILNFLD